MHVYNRSQLQWSVVQEWLYFGDEDLVTFIEVEAISWENPPKWLVLVAKNYMKYRSIRKIKQIDIGGSKKCGFRVWGCICCQLALKSSIIMTQRLFVHSESCKLLDAEM